MSVFILTPHQVVRGIEQIFIIMSPFQIQVGFAGRTSQFFTHLSNTPVVVSILQSTGCTLINTYIIRHIS